MSDTVRRTERRSVPRYIVDRDCSIFALGASTEVTLLNISLVGAATLGPRMEVSPGDHVILCLEGLSMLLDAVVVDVSYGRIGFKFDLAPDARNAWETEFAVMVAGLAQM